YDYRDDLFGGAKHADFLSLGFIMELDFLKGNKNSARLAAALEEVARANKQIELQRDRLLRDHAKSTVQVQRMQSWQALLCDQLLPQYRQQADATWRAFASNEARFFELQLVLIDLLNAELDALALDAEFMKINAALEYLFTTSNFSGDAS
ncbi:MAG: hypothetical protein ACJAZF_003518, partial [Granulosicoccus sp.]